MKVKKTQNNQDDTKIFYENKINYDLDNHKSNFEHTTNKSNTYKNNTTKQSGIVNWFNPKKGFGFLTIDQGG